MGYTLRRSLLAPIAGLAASLITDIRPMDLPAGGRRRAPRRFGDVTIRVHEGLVPKPATSDAVTVSDFTMPYVPGPRRKGRPAETYRAERRNAARAGRRWFLAA